MRNSRFFSWISGFLGICIPLFSSAQSAGSIDLSFNPGSGANSTVQSISIQNDGKILVGGVFTEFNGALHNKLVRLYPDGTIDTSFVTGLGIGTLITESVYCSAIQTDNRIVVAGAFTSYHGVPRNCITRILSDGGLDTTFNPGDGANQLIHSLAIDAGGNLVIGGVFTEFNNVSRNRVARILPSGSLDISFNPGTGADDRVWSIALQPDGKILIAGEFTAYNGTPAPYIARLNSDGSLDNTFAMGTGPNSIVQSIALQGDGKILISGMFTSFNGTQRNSIARLNSDGSLDVSFDPGAGLIGSAYSISVQNDGKIILGGSFLYYDLIPRSHVARIHVNGSLDTTFNPGLGANTAIMSTALQADGKILIGGLFTCYNGLPPLCTGGTPVNYLARLGADLTSSYEEPAVNTGFSLFPNPASGICTIRLNTPMEPESIVSVYSSMGQLVYTTRLETTSMFMDLQFLPAGIYQVRLVASGKIQSLPLVIY